MCKVLAFADSLESLVTDLHRNLKSTDWLQHNTSDKWIAENPQLAKEYMDAARGHTSVDDVDSKGQGELCLTSHEFQLKIGTLKSCSDSGDKHSSFVKPVDRLADELDAESPLMHDLRDVVNSGSPRSRTEVPGSQGRHQTEGTYIKRQLTSRQINMAFHVAFLRHSIVTSQLHNYLTGSLIVTS